jgi:hypothetical protein
MSERASDFDEKHFGELVEELRMNSCATLAAAMITVSKRRHSVHDALKLLHDIKMAMEPPLREDDDYLEWKAQFDGARRHK